MAVVAVTAALAASSAALAAAGAARSCEGLPDFDGWVTLGIEVGFVLFMLFCFGMLVMFWRLGRRL